MSIKIKNNNMGMHSPNSVNISICNNGINKGHSNITNNDDELEIDTKIYATINYEVIVEAMIELIKKNFADSVRKMNKAKTIKELNSAYSMAKRLYIALLKKPITTGELKELYNKNKARINNYSFLKKMIKLFSKENRNI